VDFAQFAEKNAPRITKRVSDEGRVGHNLVKPMRARWVFHNPELIGNVIGQSVVASWWPGRFHLISTIAMDGTSAGERLSESLKTGRPFQDVKAGQVKFLTQIFRCNKDWIVRDFSKPLYEQRYVSRDEAAAGHKLIVELFSAGKLRSDS
jgi:hypothetical protein